MQYTYVYCEIPLDKFHCFLDLARFTDEDTGRVDPLLAVGGGLDMSCNSFFFTQGDDSTNLSSLDVDVCCSVTTFTFEVTEGTLLCGLLWCICDGFPACSFVPQWELKKYIIHTCMYNTAYVLDV